LERVDFVTNAFGGKGAVREFLEFILKSQKKWDNIISRYEGN
jgi:3-deoxy-D-manno-octulosonate 8-phosphate phosphatase (KDO 8-P phosphatase)